jgi:hypothetical protein
MRRGAPPPCVALRPLLIAALLLGLALLAARSLRAPARAASPAAAWLSAAAARGARLPAGELPLLIPVTLGAGAAALLAQTLASLRRMDRAASTPLVFCVSAGAADEAAAVGAALAAVDFAPTLVLPAPPPAAARRHGGAPPADGRAAFMLAAWAIAAGARGAVILPAGLEVSQDFRDWADFVLREMESDATVRRVAFAANAFYARGEGFGGEERWLFATGYALDAARGVIIPRHSWPVARAAAPWGDADTPWATALGAAAAGRAASRALTPRISRVRFTGTDARAPPQRGADFLALPADERARLSAMYIPDHSLSYERHRVILVDRF